MAVTVNLFLLATLMVAENLGFRSSSVKLAATPSMSIDLMVLSSEMLPSMYRLALSVSR